MAKAILLCLIKLVILLTHLNKMLLNKTKHLANYVEIHTSEKSNEQMAMATLQWIYK